MEFEGSTIRIDMPGLRGPRLILSTLWRWSFGSATVRVLQDRPWDFVVLALLILALANTLA